MGTDIHVLCQKKDENNRWVNMEFERGTFSPKGYPYQPFQCRNWDLYRFFGYGLYDEDPSISMTRRPRDLPDDLKVDDDCDYKLDGMFIGEYGFNWMTVEELFKVDYDKKYISFYDFTETEEKKPLRDLLGNYFFKDLDKIKELGVERIIVGFDS